MELTFNMNSQVKVKLTQLGYQHLADEHNEYIGIVSAFKTRSADYYKALADKDGFTSFQLWVFIQSFGKVTGMGFKPCYDNNIVFSDTDLEFIPTTDKEAILNKPTTSTKTPRKSALEKELTQLEARLTLVKEGIKLESEVKSGTNELKVKKARLAEIRGTK